MNVTQGKLCLGCRTNTAPDSDDYPALIVYNGILGGGIHSKLFRNVREKASLAYYAYSMLEKFKGLMVISCGIDISNKQKALEIIEEQLADMARATYRTGNGSSRQEYRNGDQITDRQPDKYRGFLPEPDDFRHE